MAKGHSHEGGSHKEEVAHCVEAIQSLAGAICAIHCEGGCCHEQLPVLIEMLHSHVHHLAESCECPTKE